MIPGPTGAPQNNDELCEHYGGAVRGWVRVWGIAAQDVDDVAQELLLKFMEKGALAWYDAARLHETAIGRRTSRFPSFLKGWCAKYVLQARDRQVRLTVHEPLRLEWEMVEAAPGREPEQWGSTIPSPPSGLPAHLWGPGRQPADCQSEEFELAEWVRAAHEYLASLPVRGRRDLARCFRLALETSVRTERGVPDRLEMSIEMGMSRSAVGQTLRDVRKELERAGFGAELRG